jgi:hypothetical protein
MSAAQEIGFLKCSRLTCRRGAAEGHAQCQVHLDTGRRSAARRGPMGRCAQCRKRIAKRKIVDGLCLTCASAPTVQLPLTMHEINRVRNGKWCAGPCGQHKRKKDFHKRAANADGRQSYCKECERSSKNNRADKESSVIHEKKRICYTCFDLEEDRPANGCKACGEPYRSLESQLEDRYAEIRSGFGQGTGFSYPNNAF